MNPRKRPVTDAPDNDLSPQQKIDALTAKILQLQRKIAKDYASSISDKNEIKALKEENERLHGLVPDPKERLESLQKVLRKVGGG